MAVSTVEVAFTKQYGSQIYTLAQQTKSRFASRVRNETVVGAKAKAFERLGQAECQQIDTRHGDTPINEIPHSRRWVNMLDWDTGSMIDKEDSWKMLINPRNKYAQAQSMTLGRKMDDRVIVAALGTAKCGEDQGTDVLFKDDSISINGDATATTLGTLAVVATVADMSLAKMLLMMQIFNQEDVDPDIRKYWAVNPKTTMDMLNLTEVKSADYNIVKVLTEGKMSSYMGFNWFWSNRITKDAVTETGYRSIAWAEDGIILGKAKNIMSRISERDDKRYSMQVYSCMSIGAVRMEGAKVHECINKVA